MSLERYRTRRHAGAIFQLLVLVVLQSYFLAPVYRQMYLSPHPSKTCHQDHRLCGCAPERIATKTCCCFRSVASCCLTETQDEECQTAPAGESTGRHELTSSPCGSENVSAALSLDKLKFIFPASLFPLSPEATIRSFPSLVVGVPDRFPEGIPEHPPG